MDDRDKERDRGVLGHSPCGCNGWGLLRQCNGPLLKNILLIHFPPFERWDDMPRMTGRQRQRYREQRDRDIMRDVPSTGSLLKCSAQLGCIRPKPGCSLHGGSYMLELGPALSQGVCQQEAGSGEKCLIQDSSTPIGIVGMSDGVLTAVPHCPPSPDDNCLEQRSHPRVLFISMSLKSCQQQKQVEKGLLTWMVSRAVLLLDGFHPVVLLLLSLSLFVLQSRVNRLPQTPLSTLEVNIYI